MRTINNIEDLRTERARLRMQRATLEEEIKVGFKEVKQGLHPLHLAKKGAQMFLLREKNGVVSDSVGLVADLIARKLIFRNSSLITKLIAPLLVKNVTSNVVHDNKDKILGWIGSILLKLDKKNKKPVHNHHPSDESTAHTDFSSE